MGNLTPEKLSLCIAFPGNNCRRNTTFAVHVYNLVRHLQDDFRLTLAFRTIHEPLDINCDQIAILEPSEVEEQGAFFTPNDFRAVKRYLRSLERFADNWSDAFDYVIEKTWRLDGALTFFFANRGVPGAPVLEAEFHLSATNTKHFPRSFFQAALWPLFRRYLVASKKTWLKSADTIVTETRQMHSWLIEHDYIDRDSHTVLLPAAYDREVFYPRDRAQCRRELRLEHEAIIATYVGSLNCLIHDPLPLLEALADLSDPNLILCMIGDGRKRMELEEFSTRHGIQAVFTGRIGQQEACRYIGASNVCLAPYNIDFYPERKFTSGSLKTVEYLASARPVVSIPCGRMKDLLKDGRYGFLVDNNVQAYREFFHGLTRQSLLAKEKVLLQDVREGKLSDTGYALDFEAVSRRLVDMVRGSGRVRARKPQ